MVEDDVDADLLPAYLTRFVGREAELVEIADWLTLHRVVTLSGVGGSGKTRLAIEVARRIRESSRHGTRVEVCWVPLEAVAEPAAVAAAIAHGLPGSGPVSTTVVGLRNALRGRSVLVVLDNCESVAGACRDVLEALLPECRGVRVLATSRVPLNHVDEQVFAMPPLEEAVDLFLDRTALVAPGWVAAGREADSVPEICRILQGLPLAIELAASWIRTLSPSDLIAELRRADESLSSHSAPVADRHRSLSVILDSSWQWLNQSERTVLSALAVFVGGFTREGAAEVAGATLPDLARLTERALIQRLPDPGGRSRYVMHELVRGHALHRLRNAGAIRTRHLSYFLSVGEGRGAVHQTPAEVTSAHPLGPELGNFSAALEWALDHGETAAALRMVVALCGFWRFSTPPHSARIRLLNRALALPWAATTTHSIRARADALGWLGNHLYQAHPEAARDLYAEAGRMFAAIGDQAREAGCLRNHGSTLLALGDLAGCRREQRRSLAVAQALGDRQGEAWSISYIADVELTVGNPSTARRHYEHALSRFVALDNAYGVFSCRVQLMAACRQVADFSTALDLARQAIRDVRTHRFTYGVTDLIDGVALVAVDLSEFRTAAELMGAASAWRQAYEELSDTPHHEPLRRGEAVVRNRLGEGSCAAARARGARWSTDTTLERSAEVIALLSAVLRTRPSGLTRRELEVLQLLAEGLRNSEIAARLVVSKRTVHAHLRSIFTKLGVDNRTAACRRAADLLPRP